MHLGRMTTPTTTLTRYCKQKERSFSVTIIFGGYRQNTDPQLADPILTPCIIRGQNLKSRGTVKQWKRREETESGGEKERFGRNPVCLLASPLFCLFLVSLWATDDRLLQPDTISRQQFANVFPTHQFEFANFSLPCEGRFREPRRQRQRRKTKG